MSDDRNNIRRKSNKNNQIRGKYLSLDHSLTQEEKSVIERDLSSPEYQEFRQDSGKNLILPEEYSAEKTYPIIEAQISKSSGKNRNWKSWSIAASIALLVGLSMVFITKSFEKDPRQILATTGHGERLEVILPDSSTVILNSLSSLSYPEKFSKKKREISLTGEGYFEVRKDAKTPFVVHAGDIRVEVLGTKFNIEAYDNEETISTSLFEGSVALHTPDGQSQVMVPNDVAVYNKLAKVATVEKTDLSSVTQWQKGNLVFEDCALSEIFKTLERYDNIRFVVDKDIQADKFKITARFIHNESITEILDVLSNSGGFIYNRQGKQIFIHPEK